MSSILPNPFNPICTPYDANFLATANPMPLVEPVINATLPGKFANIIIFIM